MDSDTLPFSCHGAPCSVLNEAYWLGIFGADEGGPFLTLPKYHGNTTYVKRDWVHVLNTFWARFKDMRDLEGNSVGPEIFQRLELPDYAANLAGGKDGIVPLPCDPR